MNLIGFFFLANFFSKSIFSKKDAIEFLNQLDAYVLAIIANVALLIDINYRIKYRIKPCIEGNGIKISFFYILKIQMQLLKTANNSKTFTFVLHIIQI